MKKIAVFASGNGSNLEALACSILPLDIQGRIELVFCDNQEAFALQRARKHQLDCFSFSPKEFKDRKEYDRALLSLVQERKIDLIVLAGYMLLLGEEFILAFQDRILNIHPSLLPSFKGLHGIREAYEYGVKVTGVTVHFVDRGLDSGPIIVQEALEVRDLMTLQELEEEIHKIEHRLYPLAVKYFCEGRLVREGRKIRIMQSS